MMLITPDGHRVFFAAIVEQIAKVHLFTDDGELTGHGYAPKQLTPGAWSLSGRYPEQTWNFEAGDRVQVKGYFLTNEAGLVLMSDDFDIGPDNPEDFTIEHRGSKIMVNIQLTLLGDSA